MALLNGLACAGKRALQGLALFCLGLSLASCGQPAGNEPASAPAPSITAPAPVTATAPSDPATLALLASLPAPYNAGDIDAGRREFVKCRSCHTLNPDGPNQTGPNLHGIFGRKAATHGDFVYSQALKSSGIVWDAEQLDHWIASPATALPGNYMVFAGIKDASKRRDLIAYLKVAASP